MIGARQPDDERFARLRKLTQVSRALTYAVSLDEVMRLTVRSAAELLDSDKTVLMLSNEEGLLSVRAEVGLERSPSTKFLEPLDEKLGRHLEDLLGTKADQLIGVPIVVNGSVTGILAARADLAGATAEENEWLLSALADQAAVALEKSHLAEVAAFRERIIAIVSHDLRNPINAIVLGAGALLNQADLGERPTKIAARIKSSADRATRLIRDLLDYAQAHLGSRIPIDIRAADLHLVLRQVIDELGANNPQRQIEVRETGSTLGEWDADRLAQVLENLVSNALAYSAPQSIVHVDLQGAEERVTITVHNEGPPIAQERLPHIFEPMQRAVRQDWSSRSVGLGLYIVRHLVEAHGGEVSVRSVEKEGTLFSVQLPRRASPKAAYK